MHIEYNDIDYIRKLVNKHPYLFPHHIYGDDFGKPIEPYEYDWCEISGLPLGWQLSFIQDFLDELDVILVKNNKLHEYFVITTREENNHFKWRGNLDFSLPEIEDLVKKYDKIASQHCYYCGKEPDYRSTWGYFVCKSCAQKEFNRCEFPVWELEFEIIDKDS